MKEMSGVLFVRKMACRPLFRVLLLMVFLGGCATITQQAGTPTGEFQFGVIGDQEYNAESEAKFPNLMTALNQAPLAFVIHVGDIGAPPSGSCKDETFSRRKDEFQQSTHPFIYTPGDNEWTDCHGPKAGAYNPVERLAKLREVFFRGDQSLGQSSLRLARQSNDPHYAKFRENARWVYGDVLFVTLNIPGSNNNLGRTPRRRGRTPFL